MRVITEIDGHAVELWIGDQHYRSRYLHFLEHYDEIRRHSEQATRFRLAAGRQDTGKVNGKNEHKSIFATGLDAGSTYTRCVIALLEDERLRLLGYGSVPSEGWAKSRIADQQAVSDCVLAAVEEAEAMAQTTDRDGRRGHGRAHRARREQPRPHGSRAAARNRTARHQSRHGSRACASS